MIKEYVRAFSLYRKLAETGVRTPEESHAIYDAMDDYDYRADTEGRRVKAWRSGKVVACSFSEARDGLTSCVIEEIATLEENENVIEVGSGGGLNLVRIRKRFPDLQIMGTDTSSQRLKIAKESYGDSLAGIELVQDSIQSSNLPDESADMVFSVHVLEQLPYDGAAAVKNMLRIARKKVVLLEPWFRSATRLERLYICQRDYIRNLAEVVEATGLPFTVEPTEWRMNPVNPSFKIVIRK